MYVIDDYNVPGPTGHSVRLVWRGLPPGVGSAFGCPLLVVCGILGAAGVFLPLRLLSMQGPLLVASSLLFFYVLFSVLRRREAPEFPMDLTWEARDRELRVGHRGALPLLSTPEAIAFDRVRLIEFEIGAEGRADLQVRCRVHAEGAGSIDVPMRIRGVDRRAKALDLALRVGAAMGWQGYRFTKCTPRALRVELRRLVEEGPRSGAVPSKDDDPTYETAGADALPEVPPCEIPRFEPKTYTGPYRVWAWDPGREVRFERPSPSIESLVAEGLVWALAGFVLAMLGQSAWCLFPLGADPATDACVLTSTVLTVLTGLFIRQYWRGRKTIHLDWASREVRVTSFLSRSVTPFRELRTVVLRGHTSAVTAAGGTQPWAWNWCELLIWTDNWSIIIPGPRYQGDVDTPLDMMLPMAVDLAKSLGIPWVWQDYAIPPGTA